MVKAVYHFDVEETHSYKYPVNSLYDILRNGQTLSSLVDCHMLVYLEQACECPRTAFEMLYTERMSIIRRRQHRESSKVHDGLFKLEEIKHVKLDSLLSNVAKCCNYR